MARSEDITRPKTNARVRLFGEDGNAYAILGRCQRALLDAGEPPEVAAQFREEATAGDYNHLVRTVMEWFVVDEDDQEQW